ncbi:DNA mismatch repair protein MutT [Streptomyces sp. NPDC002536]
MLHTDSHGIGPSDALAARDEILRLTGGGELTVRMWALSPTLWEDLLVDAGFLVEDITVLDAIALVLDEVGGINRMTAVAVVTAFDGTPAATEPHLVSSRQWRALDELPDPLFVPSAQALRTWRPDLPVDHPPVRTYWVVQQEG